MKKIIKYNIHLAMRPSNLASRRNIIQFNLRGLGQECV